MMTQALNPSKRIEILPTHSWQEPIDLSLQKRAISSLESGKVLFFPNLHLDFTSEELQCLSQAQIKAGTKNLSYYLKTGMLRGSTDSDARQQALRSIIHRYVLSTQILIQAYFPSYAAHLQIGRTSLRPIEIEGRIAASYRKDDTRLHVDAFPAHPNQGRRILRIFYNYYPHSKPRVWRLGESFENVAGTFLPHIKKPLPGSAWLLETLKITKTRRTPYDHYMLHLHDNMKHDVAYQKSVDSEIIAFPANTTWMVYTDCVSHAALSGQHVLEQTFYLPIAAMQDPERSPLKILERLMGKTLI